jgi:nitrite reductase/ring-hydroxylating ferredoxin subunit
MEEEFLKSGLVKVCDISEIPIGKMKHFEVDGKEMVIANVNGIYYAIGSICTHKGSDLSRGTLEGNTVTCPKHKAKFDVTNGKVIPGPKVPLTHPKIKDEPIYTLKIEGKDILLEHQ